MNQSHIRNFSIIAHIDHGKTTLTDQLLKITHTVSERELHERMMDSNPIEQERGITIKLAPVRMSYQMENEEFELNLIDTPGHVDFGYEVSRSLAACEGALLVVDATQGIQAQTLSNFEKAQALGLKVIPVINKIDLPSADVDSVKLDLMEMLGIHEDEIVAVSAKTGLGIERLLETIISKIPSPKNDNDLLLRALVFTSQYDAHKGVLAYVKVVEGEMNREQLHLLASKTNFLPVEIGYFSPSMKAVPSLQCGEVGYLATGLKDVSKVRVGDTIVLQNKASEMSALPGYKEPKPMVYMDFYPVDGNDFMLLQDAMAKLSLHDAALQYLPTHSVALGNGLRVGFLGILHNEIVRERLEREFDLDLITTSPSVTYQIRFNTGELEEIHNPSELPDPSLVKEILEPMTTTQLFFPREYYGAVIQLCQDARAEVLTAEDIGTRMKLTCQIPLAELIVQFHDELKSVTSGFGSMEYELAGFQLVDAVKLDIMIQHERIEALSQIVVREKSEMIGRRIVKTLKEVLPRQQFELPIQAAIGGKIIARETVKAFRKDVTAKLYGGDVTRRKKLLEKQKKGKKRMKEIGKVTLNQEAFLAVLKK